MSLAGYIVSFKCCIRGARAYWQLGGVVLWKGAQRRHTVAKCYGTIRRLLAYQPHVDHHPGMMLLPSTDPGIPSAIAALTGLYNDKVESSRLRITDRATVSIGSSDVLDCRGPNHGLAAAIVVKCTAHAHRLPRPTDVQTRPPTEHIHRTASQSSTATGRTRKVDDDRRSSFDHRQREQVNSVGMLQTLYTTLRAHPLHHRRR